MKKTKIKAEEISAKLWMCKKSSEKVLRKYCENPEKELRKS